MANQRNALIDLRNYVATDSTDGSVGVWVDDPDVLQRPGCLRSPGCISARRSFAVIESRSAIGSLTRALCWRFGSREACLVGLKVEPDHASRWLIQLLQSPEGLSGRRFKEPLYSPQRRPELSPARVVSPPLNAATAKMNGMRKPAEMIRRDFNGDNRLRHTQAALNISTNKEPHKAGRVCKAMSTSFPSLNGSRSSRLPP